MIELVTPEPVDGEEIPTVELFSIDGTVYCIPDRAKPVVANRYLMIARKQGVGIAESWLAETMLGTAALTALLEYENLTQDQMNEIIATARAIVFGEVRPKDLKPGPPLKTVPKTALNTSKTTTGPSTRKRPSKATSRASTK